MFIDFQDAKSLEDLKKETRRYDISGVGKQTREINQADNVTRTELKSALKELVSSIKTELKNVKHASVAAIRPNVRERTPPVRRPSFGSDLSNNYRQDNRRDQSPSRDYYHPRLEEHYSRSRVRELSPFNNNNDRYKNNQYSDQRQSRSPQRSNHYENRQFTPYRSADQQSKHQPSDYSRNNNEHLFKAFDNEEYFAKFGRPPTTCTNCNLWHWIRHCPNHLN